MYLWRISKSHVVSILFAITSSLFLNAKTTTKSTIITADDVEMIEHHLHKAGDNAIIFIDVDETVITPISHMFRFNSPDRKLIAELWAKNNKHVDEHGVLIAFLQKRKCRLVSPKWPEIIASVSQRIPVYALTQMESGKYGPIQLEDWRYQELQSHGVFFTPSYNARESYEFLPALENMKPPLEVTSAVVFHKGFFMTPRGKGEVVKKVIEEQRPVEIVFIDDREDHVNDVASVCSEHGVNFTGIIWCAAERIPGSPNPQVVELQKRFLFQHHQWLEDDFAEQLLAQEQASNTTAAQTIRNASHEQSHSL